VKGEKGTLLRQETIGGQKRAPQLERKALEEKRRPFTFCLSGSNDTEKDNSRRAAKSKKKTLIYKKEGGSTT